VPITFPSSPSNADEYTFNGRTYTYNAARGVWLGSRGGSSSAGGGGGAALTVSDTAPTSASEGDLWFHSTLLETYVYYNSQWVLSNPSGGGGGSGASLTSSDTAPATPSAGDLWFNSTDLTTYVYYDDGSSSQWVSSMPSGVTAGSGGGGVSVISGTENFPANTDSSTGDMVYETDSNKLFIFNGSGWDSIQATQNQAPTWSPITTSFTLSNDGTPTVVNLNATDPEGIPLTYNYSIDSGNSAIATVALSGNTLTVTPTTDNTVNGSFILSVSAYDNSGNSVTQPFNFALSWGVAATTLWRYLVVTQSSNSPPYLDLEPDADHGFYESSGGTEILASHTHDDLDPGNANTYAYFASGTDPLTGQRELYDWVIGDTSYSFVESLNSTGTGGSRAVREQVAGDFIAIGFATATSIDTLGHINFRTYQDGRPDRVPVSAKLQYYTGDVTQAYDSNLWEDYATLNKGTITSGTHVWTNITDGSTITSTTG